MANREPGDCGRGGRVLEEITDWSFTTLLSQVTRLAVASQPFNLVATNVPGPQFPLYFLGARMLECYPLVPIFHNEALGISSECVATSGSQNR